MSSESKMITLKSSDNETFEVEEAVATESQTIKHIIKDDRAKITIPLPKITSKILVKVIEYCKKHVTASDEDDLKKFDADFVKVDHATLFELLSAACELKIESLVDLTSQEVADMVKDKQVEELRKIFNIKNDFTPEEEEEIRMDNAWAFE